MVVVETHPVQYHAPVYRTLARQFGLPVTVLYGSDFSVAGYYDRQFAADFAWDSDLLAGYKCSFLSRVSDGGARCVEQVSARGIGNALQSLDAKVLLVLGYSPVFYARTLYEAWRRGYAILFRGETNDQARRRGLLKSSSRSIGLRWMYRRCARLLYIGERSRGHFMRLGCPEEKLVFSPYCVDTSTFQWDEGARTRVRAEVRQRLGIGGDDIALLFSGKLVPGKRPDLVLRAVKELAPEIRTRIVVVFMGSGEARDALELLGRQSPSVRVQFLGFQNQRALSQYYQSADLLVHPSLSETWGLVINEALHHGVPCVVSDAVGCAPDLVQPGVTGEVFSAASPGALTLALERALGLVGRAEIRERCREKVAGYTVEKAAEGIAQAYWEVVEGNPCPSVC